MVIVLASCCLLSAFGAGINLHINLAQEVVLSPILQIRRLRLRQVRKYAEDHYTPCLSRPLFSTESGVGVERDRDTEKNQEECTAKQLNDLSCRKRKKIVGIYQMPTKL